MHQKYVHSFLAGLLLLMMESSFAQQDVRNSKDHPLFTRMPDYVIGAYV
jgi:hypothetical protein